jgi:hypothetical protein
MKFTKTFALVGCIAAFASSNAFGQEANAVTENVAPAVSAKIANTQDGVLSGKVFTNQDGVATPVSAKVTLSSDGVVLNTVEADKDGSFAFQGIEAGSYQLLGSADGYVGGQAYDVQPFVADSVGTCSSCNLGLETVEAPVTETIYQAPASACGCSSCGSGVGGGGIGGGFGGAGGGIGGGGLLSGRRLLALGAAGGIIAIATSDNDDDDDDLASADQ